MAVATGLWGHPAARWGRPGRLWGGLTAVADASYSAYNCVLEGQGLILAAGGYERRLAQQFASKLGSGTTSSRDRLGDQVVTLDDWSGGDGYLRHDPDNPARYRSGAGIDVYSQPGAVGLGPHVATAQATSYDELTVAAVYGTKLHVGAANGDVRSWDGSTWSTVHATAKAGGIRSMAVWAGKLYYGSGTDGAVFSWDGSSTATAFTVASSPLGVRALAVHSVNSVPLLFVAAEFAAGCKVSTWDGTSQAAVATLDEPRVEAMAVLGDQLVIVGVNTSARTFTIYTRGSATGDIVKRQVTNPTGWIVSAAVLNGALYLGDAMGGRLWKWDGSKLSLVRQLSTEVAPYTAELRGLVAWRGALWLTIVESGGTLGVLRFDGTAWSQPISGLTGTAPRALAVYTPVGATADRLFILTATSSASALYNTNGTYRATGTTESGVIDADLSGATKTLRFVVVSHSPLVSGQTVEVQYQTEDSSGWTSLGSSSTVGTTSATLSFPETTQAELVAFRTILTGASGSATPLTVYSVTLRYVPMPVIRREWSLDVRLEGTTERKLTRLDGTEEGLTGELISQNIWSLIGENTPLRFLDLDRQIYRVRVTDFSEVLAQGMPQIRANQVGYDLRGRLRLAQV